MSNFCVRGKMSFFTLEHQKAWKSFSLSFISMDYGRASLFL